MWEVHNALHNAINDLVQTSQRDLDKKQAKIVIARSGGMLPTEEKIETDSLRDNLEAMQKIEDSYKSILDIKSESYKIKHIAEWYYRIIQHLLLERSVVDDELKNCKERFEEIMILLLKKEGII